MIKKIIPTKEAYAIITGASSGIGIHYARQLFEIGYNVLLVSNQEKEVKECAESINNIANSGNNIAVGLYMDLSKTNAATDLLKYCDNNKIFVEVLINNAGVFYYQDVIDCTIKQIDLMLNLHMYTVTMLCRVFGERMKNRGKGYILNMSSISVYTPFAGISLYTATKSYIRTFSLAFRLEMKDYGIKVLTVCPGAVATDLYKLPKKLQRLGVRIGVIYKPELLVKNALKMLFYRNRAQYIPGVINYLFKPIYAIIPLRIKMWARKKQIL
jgi:Short-chain dehydrogenases of various substrate specificities